MSKQAIDLKKEQKKSQTSKAKREEEAAEAAAKEEAASLSSPDASGSPLNKKKLEAMKKKKGAADMMERKSGKKAAEKGKPGKVMRTWDDAKPKKGDDSALDFSDQVDADSEEAKAAFNAKVAAKRAEFGMAESGGVQHAESSDDEYSDGEEDEDAAEASATGGGLFGYLKSKLGQAPLTAEDLAPALEAFHIDLTRKNVASDTAQAVVESVRGSLVGKTLGTFTGVSSTFKAALRTALERILTPKRSIDILRGIDQAKAKKEPYVIVVCGVNGVGKSTSLSKLAHWLMANNAGKIMITACDTFRSGAVEQLRVHAECLDVHLYAEGYAKDAAVVAANGIAYAKREGHNSSLNPSLTPCPSHEVEALTAIDTDVYPDCRL